MAEGERPTCRFRERSVDSRQSESSQQGKSRIKNAPRQRGIFFKGCTVSLLLARVFKLA